jgi:hypothetical protein
MGRIIRGQVIASTGLDAHGEALPEEAIQRLFEQLQDPSVSFRNHDTSQAPVCRGFNKRLERGADGNLAIVIDLEVLDEAAFNAFGGFSIAFTRGSVRFGSNPAVRVLVNPRHFDFEQVAKEIGDLLPQGESLDVTERIEKTAVLEAAIIVVTFIAGAAAKGFLGKVGGELFDYLKKRRSHASPAEPTIHLHVTCEIRQRPVVLLLVADPLASPSDLAGVDLEALMARVEAFAAGAEIQRAVGIIRPGGSVELCFVMLPSGRTIEAG